MTIWKYELKITDFQKIANGNIFQRIKVGDKKAKVLSVAGQDGKLVMWVQLDEDYAKTGDHEIEVQIIGTGIPFQAIGDFVGTVVISYGLVWHVYIM